MDEYTSLGRVIGILEASGLNTLASLQAAILLHDKEDPIVQTLTQIKQQLAGAIQEARRVLGDVE
jgi:signal transduction histidine kinase